MIPKDEAKELIKEKREELETDDLSDESIVELMRQACAIQDARSKDSGTQRGVSHCINVLATHREELLGEVVDPSEFQIEGMDRGEIEANYMQVAINKIKLS